jgi:hypothetical protein
MFFASAIGMNRVPGRELFGHFEPDFLLDDFPQGDVSSALVRSLAHQRLADGSAAGVELPDTTGDQINQNVWISNFQQCLSTQFAIQWVLILG